jgi:hypothetical protein
MMEAVYIFNHIYKQQSAILFYYQFSTKRLILKGNRKPPKGIGLSAIARSSTLFLEKIQKRWPTATELEEGKRRKEFTGSQVAGDHGRWRTP